MKTRLIPIAAIAVLLLAGCEKSPSESAKAVEKTRESAAEDVNDARRSANKTEDKSNEKVAEARQDYANSDASAREDLGEVESEAMMKQARADFDVTTAEASGRHDVAKQKCEVLEGAERDACQSAADATLATDQAAAVATRDAILVQAERRQ